MNPFPEPAKALFDRVAFLEFLILHLAQSLESLAGRIRRPHGKSKLAPAQFFHGTQLVVRDLMEWPPDGWQRIYSAGKYHVEGEKYFTFKGEIVAMQAAWVVSQAYESFESFLLDSTAYVLHRDPTKADTARLSKSCSPIDNAADVEHWRRCVRDVFRREGNQKLVNFLGKHYPVIRKAETQNNRQLNLRHWFKASGTVRHAVTHSTGVVRPKTLESLSEVERGVLYSSYGGCHSSEGYKLQLSVAEAQGSLRLFAEYGYLIAKSLSDEAGFEWRLE